MSDVVLGLATTWSSLRELAVRIPDVDRPTRVPGWSVRDNYSHVTSTLLALLGRPDDNPPLTATPPHVRNDLGRKNEPPVDARRSRPGSDVIDEFAGVSLELETLTRSFTDGQLGAETQFMGRSIAWRELLSIVLMDNWIHEQDIREAVGIAGHDEGPAVEHSCDRMLRRIAGRVADVLKKDERLIVRVRPPVARQVVITTSGMTDETASSVPEAQTSVLTLDAVVLAALAAGRVDDPFDAGSLGVLEADGDADLTGRALAVFAFTS